MSPEGKAWFAALREHIRAARISKPLPEVESFSGREEFQYRLEGGTLVAWLDRHSPRLLAERAVLAKLVGWDPEPFIVVVSDATGLAAAHEIVGNSERIAYLYAEEFDAFSADRPDTEYLGHVRFVNYITEPSSSQSAATAAAKYPLLQGEELWIHVEESYLGPRFARGAKHLIKWDGSKIAILEEAFEHWIS